MSAPASPSLSASFYGDGGGRHPGHRDRRPAGARGREPVTPRSRCCARARPSTGPSAPGARGPTASPSPAWRVPLPRLARPRRHGDLRDRPAAGPRHGLRVRLRRPARRGRPELPRAAARPPTTRGLSSPSEVPEMKTPLALAASLGIARRRLASAGAQRRRGGALVVKASPAVEPLRRRRRRTAFRQATGRRGRGPDRRDRPRRVGGGRRRGGRDRGGAHPRHRGRRVRARPRSRRGLDPVGPDRSGRPGRRTCAAWRARARTCGSSAGRSAGTPARASSRCRAERVRDRADAGRPAEPVAGRARARARSAWPAPGPVAATDVPALLARPSASAASPRAGAARAFLDFLATGPGNAAFRSCGRVSDR